MAYLFNYAMQGSHNAVEYNNTGSSVYFGISTLNISNNRLSHLNVGFI